MSSYEECNGKLISVEDEQDFHFNFKHKEFKFNVQFKDLLTNFNPNGGSEYDI